MAVKTTDTAKVLYDYQKWVERIHARAEEKVEEAVSAITNNTNRGYLGLDPEDSSQIDGNPVYYKMYTGRNFITGAAIAKPDPNFIYLEFGTRKTAADNLMIINNWESKIDASKIAAPYKSNNPRFFNSKASGGNYIFLSNIDIEGMKFIRNFWK